MSPSVSSPLDRSSALPESITTSSECLSWIEPEAKVEHNGASLDVVSLVQDLARTSSTGQASKRVAIADVELPPASAKLPLLTATHAIVMDGQAAEPGHCAFPLPMYMIEMDGTDGAVTTDAYALAASSEDSSSSADQPRCQFPLPLYTIEL